MNDTPDLVMIGHMTADITPHGRVAGGTVSYAARTAASFGLRVGVVTSTALNEPLVDALTPYADVRVKPAAQTTTFENHYRPEGRVQIVRGVAADLHAHDIPECWRGAPWVLLAPIANEVQWNVASVFSGATVMLTLQGWLRRWSDEGQVRFKRWHDEQVLSTIDIMVFSEEDIAEAPEMERVYADSVRDVLVTRAARGGTYYHRGCPVNYETPRVESVHPTGAGDVFAAALLASLRAFDGDFGCAIQVAARLGAISVTRFGLESAPTVDEVNMAIQGVWRASDG
jgi:sugar/nucleoside kinase (ribokinase family)